MAQDHDSGTLADWPIPRGFRAAACKAGIKPSGALDLALLVTEGPVAAAGTFTTNRVCAAPVQWDRQRLPSPSIRGLVINAGNANAATGEQGLANAARTAALLAQRLSCSPDQVLVASTGVIGHQLPMEKLETGIHEAFGGLSEQPRAFHEASLAIMTTDSRPKVVGLERELPGLGRTARLVGLAKGAAMIGPNMATMLAFLTADVPVDPAMLQAILRDAVEDTFNCISVEGHMSTNDTVLLLAGPPPGEALGLLTGEALDEFAAMVHQACATLAKMIPADGEGATHLITIDVEGCSNRGEARQLARAVADSPLVKTAIHGADPNWGRIVSAAGYAGIDFDEREVSLWLNGVLLYENGTPRPFDAEEVSRELRSLRETHIRLTFQRGLERARFWTCDLTAEYVRLNADYTT